jgi:hypothetical protein
MLMAEGHQHASRYPLSTLWIEVELATERINRRIATEALVMQAVVGTVMGGKEGAKHLKSLLKRLNDGN